jgi:aryl-alcohol dehydrogenase-like predicted oxidoreductase
MEYARLGRSSMRVSKLALGTMNFGVRTDEAEAEADVAAAWVLANPAVTTLLLGPRTLEQFEASVRAAQIGLPPDVLARLDEIFPPLYDRSSSVAPRR